MAHLCRWRGGEKLGPYEIVGLLGAGGMGEVYRARDTRLRREVALKILPAELALDPARRQRFELEARTVAAFNHPNIVAIYDVGAEGGVFYIVTELVDGQPLRGGPFPLRKSLDCGAQIANGLAAAHAAGIVHRDLKPDNVLLTRDGRIKILDFGLAKANALRTPAGATETLTVHTAAGVVLGTAGYMSPEQVRGEEAGPRSDVFSLGVILYEMLGGRRAFHGDTAVETMAAILKQDPPELPDTAPPAVRQVVSHCLEKDPENRFQSARDLSFALSAMAQSGTQSGAAPKLPVASRWRRRALAAGAALALVALGVAAGRLLGPAPAARDWTGALLGGPETAFDPRLSPDGHLVAFQAMDRSFTQVALMKPETGNWSMLTHDRQHGLVANVAWAPDGAAIYYDRVTDVARGIYSVPVLGGDEHLVFENAFRPEPLPDGSLLAVRLNAGHQWQLFRFWPDSGRVQDLPVAVLGPTASLGDLRAFPNGKEAVVYGAPLGREAGGMRLRVVDLDSGASRPFGPAPQSGIASPAWAISRDGESVLVALQLGSFARVISVPANGRSPAQTLFTTASQMWYLDAAPDGSVYGNVVERPSALVRRTLDGRQSETIANFPNIADGDTLAVLPDGRVTLAVLQSGRARLMAAQAGKDPVALATTTEETAGPVTAVGPRQVAFMIGPLPHETIALADAATGRILRRIAPGKGEILSLAASPDGATLYFAAGGAIWSVPASGGDPRRIRAGDRVVANPAGRALLVSLAGSPAARLFRVPLDGGLEREITSDGSAALDYSSLSPGAWNADGRLLVPVQDSWFTAPAVLDTTTGRVLRLPFDGVSDYNTMAWLPDGRIVALSIGTRSVLWRFAPAKE